MDLICILIFFFPGGQRARERERRLREIPETAYPREEFPLLMEKSRRPLVFHVKRIPSRYTDRGAIARGPVIRSVYRDFFRGTRALSLIYTRCAPKEKIETRSAKREREKKEKPELFRRNVYTKLALISYFMEGARVFSICANVGLYFTH